MFNVTGKTEAKIKYLKQEIYWWMCNYIYLQ